jgi:hypothetical protein
MHIDAPRAGGRHAHAHAVAGGSVISGGTVPCELASSCGGPSEGTGGALSDGVGGELPEAHGALFGAAGSTFSVIGCAPLATTGCASDAAGGVLPEAAEVPDAAGDAPGTPPVPLAASANPRRRARRSGSSMCFLSHARSSTSGLITRCRIRGLLTKRGTTCVLTHARNSAISRSC